MRRCGHHPPGEDAYADTFTKLPLLQSARTPHLLVLASVT
jgi:hypothetical protein